MRRMRAAQLHPVERSVDMLVNLRKIACKSGVVLALSLVVPAAIAAQSSGPLLVRNITPVAHLYGVPAALGSRVWRADSSGERGRLKGLEYGVNLEHASSFTSVRTARSSVFFDGETTVASYSLRGALTPVFGGKDRYLEWGLALPLVMHSGGFLDGAIDEFHETFDFRDGGRSIAPRNQIDYLVQIDGEVYANFQDSKTRVGDARAWLGYQLFDDAQRSLAVRTQLKLPTGSVRSLSGSGAADLATWLEYGEHSLLDQFGVGVNIMLGAAYLGKGDLAPNRQESAVGFAQLGLYYQYNAWLQLHAQLAGQTKIIDSQLLQAQGAAVQVTIGGRMRLRERLWMDLGLVEDIRTKSSADVVFHLRLSAQL